ncbi:molybdopterin-dependent oxidoreductase [Halarcobacter anaerophilus]|uniref:Tetrathionate reductase subunit TtrA n=1 Tax=Halarcobacter anaerophilus TaxID=877500 RepID=A0A4Q0Y0D1_9BACT|nr:molybdopterin-dependent oxidoreductase [Halarcobacter anaerophilus]QDF28683.1 tetrathionate reductase TtrABC, subunit A [Halarcobacter anaerophilus]RXJ63402.1 tetrathionate reductase subunit TtrA [Halarcobacter anaerophilus]
MNKNRRRFLLGTTVVAGCASVVGYKDTLKAAATMSRNGVKTQDPIYTNSLETEGEIEKIFSKNEEFSLRNSVCNGCTTHCGVRVKVDNKKDTVVKVSGNPYSPLSTDPWLPYNTPIEKSFSLLGKDSKDYTKYRSTACARGNVVFDKINNELRVLKPLKRVGKRGENRWKEIEIEQLLEEITKGGNLFGEGEVEGLASIRDLKKPLKKENPEMGPKANQLCILGTGDDGRKAYMVHRFRNSFGTVNYQGHTSICGLSMRSGEASYLGDFKKYPHLKPDFEYCEYLLTFGTAPGQAGNPFKRQGKLLVKGRVKENLKCVTVAPMLTNSDNIAVGEKSEWIPILPGGDLAFAMGLLQVIINESLYNEKYLRIPSIQAQKRLNDASYTNAAHLIIQDEEKKGHILQDGKEALVIDSVDKILKKASLVDQAELFVNQEVVFDNKTYNVKSAMTLLKNSADEQTLDTYAKEAGINKEKIISVAREFTSHGRKAATDCHGGTMHTTGFYTTYAIMMLGAMVGNLNYKGGMSSGGGRYKDFKGLKYNLLGYKGKVKPKGYRVDKTRVAYEKTAEYKQKVEQGINPYPAKDTWYPFTNAIESDIITNSANEYPYKLKALISWNANFVYGQSGSQNITKLLKDPNKSVPLIIAIDPFINETSQYADYIVPDSVIYETWGVAGAWAGYQTKINTAAFPTIKPKQATFKNGEPICMDSFMIELGKKLNLPGFGENAIIGNNGKKYPLNRPQDFYIRAFENIALDKGGVPDITDEEIKVSSLEPYINTLKNICEDNWRKTAYVMARGGRFESKERGYIKDKLSHKYEKMINIYNQTVGLSKHALTGESFSGVPKFYQARLNNGDLLKDIYPKSKFPMLAFSYKSNVLSQCDASSSKLQNIRFTTYIDINPKTAKGRGLNHGDMVKLSSQDGVVKGMLRYRNGLYPECIGIEHGLGRDAQGAVSITINDKIFSAKVARKSGVNINKLGLLDTSRKLSTLCDFVIGSNARQAIPIEITKV